MKFDSVQQRFGQGGSLSNKNCNPANICRISLCCCLFGCLAPGIGLLAFTYLSYGNYQKVPAKVVAESFCGYYRRNLLKKTSSSGYNSGSRTSSSSSKQNHYRMTYEFVTLEGENITAATDCVNARRPINSTQFILYDPDDPYTIIHENDASGYLIFGVSLVVIGGVFSCLACVAYKILLTVFGNMNGSNNNPNHNNNGMPAEPTGHSGSNSGGNPSAANPIASVISQIWNPNANNNPNTSAAPQNNFSSPDASPAYNVNNSNNNNYTYGNSPPGNSFGNNNNTYTNANMYGNSNNPYGNTMGNTYANPGNNNGYGDASNSFNDTTAAHNFNHTNHEYNNNTTFGNNGNMGYNGSNIPVPSAPPAPTASGYRPP